MRFRHVGALADVPVDVLSDLMERGGGHVDVVRDVAAIRERVLKGGDDALRQLTHKHDGVLLDALEVQRPAWDAALARVSADIVDALRQAHANIRTFAQASLPQAVETTVVPGVRAGRRIVPIARVGAYVPGGRAAYPSTVLMTATPAKVAGVDEIIVVTPPGKDGRVPDATLAACAVAGVDRVFAVGGAQAVFALAYGTESIPRVDKIVGPGNAYVAAAKAMVAGRVAIDSPAGPSEVLVLGDASADADLVALELLAQAEHDPRAACIAVLTDAALAKRVETAVERRIAKLARVDVVRESLASRGAVLVAADEAAACSFSERYAPEHLVILTGEPRATLHRLRNYGSAFLGPHASVALGDYCSGPNHVLPTAGLARSHSGLGVDDFLRRPTHQQVDAEGLATLAPIAERLAAFEGLPNHAEAARWRRERS